MMRRSTRTTFISAAILSMFAASASARPRTEQPSDLIRWDDQQGNGPFRFSVLSARSSNVAWDSAPSIGRGSISLTFDLDGGVSLAPEPRFRITIHEAGVLEDVARAHRRPSVAELISSSLVGRSARQIEVKQSRQLPDGGLLLLADGGEAADRLVLRASRSEVDGSYIVAEVRGPRENEKLLIKIATSLKNAGRVSSGPESSKVAPSRAAPPPLMVAAYDGREDVVTALLRQGADPNQIDSAGPERSHCTPLYFAARGPEDDAAVLEILLNAGARIGGDPRCARQPLNEAARRGKLASVRFLLSKGADPNGRSLEGDIPLLEALSDQARSDLQVRPIIDELLRRGASVNGHAARTGWTPLVVASFVPHRADLLRHLLDQGADPRVTDVIGRTLIEDVLSGDERQSWMSAAVSRLNAPPPRPVFSKVRDGHFNDLFRFGPEARIGIRNSAVQLIDPAGNEIGAWPVCPRGCGSLAPQFIDLDGDGVADFSGLEKDYREAVKAFPPCERNVSKCPPIVSFTMLLGLRGGKTRLMLYYDAARDRLTGNLPIVEPLGTAVRAELGRRGNLDGARIERLLSRYALMADGKWMLELYGRHEEARRLYKAFQPARAAAQLEALLGEDTVRKLDPSGDPDVTVALNDLGFFLSEAGVNDRAVAVLRRVLVRAPDRAVAFLNLADAEYTLGDAASASAHYRQYQTLMERAGKTGKVPARVVDRLAGR